MRTWQIYHFALYTIVAVCADDAPQANPPTPLKPSPPTNEQAVVINSSAVFLRWEWKDGSVKPEDVKFEVSATSKDEEDKVVTVKGMRYLVLDGLAANKEYTIKIAFMEADGTRASGVDLKINTPETDPVVPKILDNKNGDKAKNTVSYTTSWSFESDPKTDNFLRFEVVFCREKCEDPVVREREETSLVGVRDYDTEYTVFVLAVSKKDEKESSVSSAPSTFRTITGTPGLVEDLEVSQIPDTLDITITWSPPIQENGKIESYDLQIVAGGNNITTENLGTPNFSFSFKKMNQIAEPNLVRVRAVDNGEGPSKGGFRERRFKLDIAPPTSVNLTSCTTDALNLNITRESAAELTFRISYPTNKIEETKGKDVVLKGFQAYAEVPLEVFACVPLEKTLFCGTPYGTSFRTNVGAPSEVRNLTVKLIDGVPKLSWSEPENTAGPISGYILRTKEDGDETNIGKVLEHDFLTARNCTQYEFTVVAFNSDLNDGSEVKGKAAQALSYKTENCIEPTPTPGGGGGGGFPTWAIVLIVLVILGAAGGGAFYYLKMRRDS